MHYYDNLIFGSSGYIGSRLLSKLPSEKNYLVSSKSHFAQFLKLAESLEFKNVFWVAGSQLPADTFEYKLKEHPDLINLKKLIKRVRRIKKKKMTKKMTKKYKKILILKTM